MYLPPAIKGQPEYFIHNTHKDLLINYTVLVYPEGGSTADVVDSQVSFVGVR